MSATVAPPSAASSTSHSRFVSGLGPAARADAARVGVVQGEGSAADVRTDCVVLSNDTRGAYQLLPTPDQALTAGLDQALQLEQSAAGDCYQGAGGDAPVLARADAERARGAVALGAARSLYHRLTGGGG